MISSRIEIEKFSSGRQSAYLFVTIRNSGDREVAVSKIDLLLTYYDQNKYQIDKNMVNIINNARIAPAEEKRYKIGLTYFYYSEIGSIEGELLVRKIFKVIK